MGATKAIAVALAALAATSAAGQQPGRATALSGSPAPFFGPDNYPPEALRNGEQGRTVAKLDVGADGRVTACTVDVSSGSASLDGATCAIALAHVTFTPATDDRGRPIAGHYTLPVRWVFPDRDAAQQRVSQDTQLQLDISADDKLLNCTLVLQGKPYPVESPWCTNVKKLNPVQLHAFKDVFGSRRATVTLQRIVQFAVKPITPVHTMPGHKLLRLTRALADVLPDGTLADRRIVEQVGIPDFTATPEKMPPFIAVPDRTDKLVVIDAISVAATP